MPERPSPEKKKRKVVLTASAIGATGIAASVIAVRLARMHKKDGDEVVLIGDENLQLDATDHDIRIEGEEALADADIVYVGPEDTAEEFGDHAEIHGINIDPKTRRGRALLQLIARLRGSSYRER
jgi:hypothetical protein